MKTKSIFKKVLACVMLLFVLVLAACAKADFTTLESAVTSSSEKVEAEYTSASWDAFEAALNSAKEVLANSKAKQEEVDAALAALNSAAEALVKLGNKTSLNEKIDEASALDGTLYTDETWAVLSNALTAANNVKNNAQATEKDVNDALAALTQALNALVEKPVDKAALESALASAATKVESEYLADKWAALQNAIEAANAVTENAEATQAQVDAALAALNAALGEAHGVVWTVVNAEYVLTNDVVRFRGDLEQTLVIDALKGLVTATVNGETGEVMIASSTYPVRDSETGLYPVGKHTLTFQALGAGEQVVTKNVEIEIIDGTTVDYYFYGNNSDTFTNANWKGGVGIRVASENFYQIVAGEELPVGLANGKLTDLVEPFAVHNTTDAAVVFTNSDDTGLHVLMDAAGKVKMIYEGIQNDYWTAEGKSKLSEAEFKALEVSLEAGDIYLVIGYSADGNYYTTFQSSEYHWHDGRFYARATLGDVLNRQTASNVVKVVCGETTITSEYQNQAPFLKSDSSDLTYALGTTVTKEMLLSGIVFADDNGVWKNEGGYVTVSAENITVEHQINGNEPGQYEVTYTISDGTLSTTYKKTATVQPVTTDYLAYTNAEGVVSYLTDASAVTIYNGVATSATGNISIYDAKYFNANKEDASKFSACNYGVYIIVDSEGKFVKSYFNGNMIDEANPKGAAVSDYNAEAKGYALSHETLEDDQYILFFQQNATVAVRQFAQNLRDAYKDRIGQAGIKVISVAGLTINVSNITYTKSNGAEVSLEDVLSYTYYNTVAPSATGNISIYDAAYFNANKEDASKFSGCNYGVYVIIDSEGKFVKSYFNTNMIDATNVWGANISGANPEAAKQALATETLEDGQHILFFQQNGTVAVRQFAQNLRDAYKNRIGEGGIKLHGILPEETPDLSYTGTYGENTREGKALYDAVSGTYTVTLPFKLYSRVQFTFGGTVLTTANTTITGEFVDQTNAPWTTQLYTEDGSTLLLSMDAELNYKFVYNPAENKLVVSLALADNEIITLGEGAGSELAAWAAGTEVKSDTAWIGNGWRLYVVIDAEGKVVYMTGYTPSGYGNPAETHLYYSHPSITDYKLNPAFVISEGGYKVVVPEGGYAFTAHGSGANALINLLTEGKIAEFGDATIANVSSQTSLHKNIRVSYNATSGIISAVRLADKEIDIKTTNADAVADAVAIWTEAGTKIRAYENGTVTWNVGQWRYYLVVDAEGKITYACNQPLSGYGNPHGGSYYVHPDYNDYTANPSIVLLEGWTTSNYQPWELVIPEGGFALTAHGAGISDILEALLGTIKVPTQPGDMNKRGIFSDDLRLAYDSEKGVVYVKEEVSYPAFSLEGLTAAADKEAWEGTDFYKAESVVKRWSDSKGVTSIEVAKKSNNGSISFTLTTAATVTFELSSSGGSNISFFSLRKGSFDGEVVACKEEAYAVYGTSKTTITYELEAGTYYLTAAALDSIDTSSDDTTTTVGEATQGNKTISGRAVRVYSITIE